jgi:hypothetical protein
MKHSEARKRLKCDTWHDEFVRVYWIGALCGPVGAVGIYIYMPTQGTYTHRRLRRQVVSASGMFPTPLICGV